MKSRYQNAFLLFGLAVLVVMLLQLDYGEMWHGVSHAGYWFVAVVALWAFLYVFNTTAWMLIIKSTQALPMGKDGEGTVPFLWLYKVTVSGFSLNYATPGGLMGGEAYRIMELSPRIGVERATSSVILYVMTHIFSHFWFWLLSVILFIILYPPLSLSSAWGWIGGVVLVLLFCFLGIWFFMVGYRKGLAVRLLNVLQHIPLFKSRIRSFVERHREKLDNIDRQVAALHRQSPRTFVACVLLELACRICSALEIYFILLVLMPSPSFLDCILILAFTSLFANMLFFIPLQLGGREGGFLMSAAGLGLSASTGAFVALLVRLRELIWTAIGLLIIKLTRVGKNALLLIVASVLVPGAVSALPSGWSSGGYPQKVQVQVDRLPDLHIPRHNHFTIYAGGVPMVVGGHTSGFKPTATAEYFSGGEWHVLNMVYPHDDAFVLPLSSGQVLMAGGHEKDLGIGQLHSVEKYDPATQSFKGFGCLDTRRVIFSGTEIDSGRVVISGNWYHEDNIELYDGRTSFTYVKAVSQQRSQPFIFRTARNNALIFGIRGTKMDEYYDSVIVDRLYGEPFSPAFFQQWKPLSNHWNSSGYQSFIGDEAKDDYAYLFPVADSTGQVAIAQLRGEEFSLMPLDHPVPMKDTAGEIQWITPVIADRKLQRGYLVGTDKDESDGRIVFYVFSIDYSHTPAHTILYYAECPSETGFSTPVLTPEGNLLIAGGGGISNFSPYSSVLLFRLGEKSDFASFSISPLYLFTLLSFIVLAALVVFFFRLYRSKRKKAAENESQEKAGLAAGSQRSKKDHLLMMERICQVMKEQQLFINKDLKVSDVADALNTNRTYISDCIRVCRGSAFPQFVNSYRVEYAKQLIRGQKDIKIAEVWIASGFSNEGSFFRNFKQFTGMTPKEWAESQ